MTPPDDDGIPTWREVASTLPPDVLHAIVFGPPPPLRVRAWRALVAWWNRPRGFAAVVAAQGDAIAATVRALQGVEDAERAAERLWEEELRRRRGRR